LVDHIVLQLRGFEFVKAVTLVLEQFTVENDLLTPTFKASAHFFFLKKNLKAVKAVKKSKSGQRQLLTVLIRFQIKRPQAKAYYEKAISNMYAELAASDPSSKKVL
jgi:long-chain acyl-CoA synthetase